MQKYQIDIKGTVADVKKTMKINPRMINEIDIIINFPINYSNEIKRKLEKSALSCPVHRSISSRVKKNIQFVYPKD